MMMSLTSIRHIWTAWMVVVFSMAATSSSTLIPSTAQPTLSSSSSWKHHDAVDDILLSVTDPLRRQKRELQSLGIHGTRTVLVVRVMLPGLSPPTVSRDELYQYIFSDSVSLKHHMARCSVGEVQLEPTNYGVIDVSVSNANHNTPRVQVVEQAQQESLRYIGGSYTTIKDVANHILFVLPDRGDNFVGSAEICPNGMAGIVTLGDRNSIALTVLMHEIGHNFNLNHAAGYDHNGDPYGDRTGNMGMSSDTVGGPQYCYNAAHHWSLDWYNQARLDLTDNSMTTTPVTVTLAAFVDYSRVVSQGMNGAIIVLIKIGSDLFVQYNRAKDYNIGTPNHPDTLVLVQSKSDGGTNLIASLDATNPFYQGMNVMIQICQIDDAASSTSGIDSMLLSIGTSSTNCPTNNVIDNTTPTVASPSGSSSSSSSSRTNYYGSNWLYESEGSSESSTSQQDYNNNNGAASYEWTNQQGTGGDSSSGTTSSSSWSSSSWWLL